jgi:ribosomal protein S18 acetylase RimI-like enzyme
MATLCIRTANKDDAALVADLSRQTFYETFAAQNKKEDMEKFMAEQFSREVLMAQVSEPGNVFLLAFVDDQPAGYARLKDSENPASLHKVDALEISRIYVMNTAIGTGIGKALMQECIQVAKKRKKEMIWLGVWEHNSRAISFYEKFGFSKFDTHVFLLGDDPQTDWLMKKDLMISEN